MFEFDLSDELREEVGKLSRKDCVLAEALKKKIKEVVSRDSETIDFYKNLRHPLEEFKRVHVGSFVLKFKVYKERNFILFVSFMHHKDAYR